MKPHTTAARLHAILTRCTADDNGHGLSLWRFNQICRARGYRVIGGRDGLILEAAR